MKFASPSAELLYLPGDRALLIWFKMRGKDVFHSIEWGSLSAELIDKHHSLFTHDEMTELSAGKCGSSEAINSAIRRTPQSVLHAFYKSLGDTQTRGGATEHASIAEEIRKESEYACSYSNQCNHVLRHCVFEPVSDKEMKYAHKKYSNTATCTVILTCQ